MMNDYGELLSALRPEFALVVGALLVLGYDLARGKRTSLDERLRVSASLGAVAVIFAAFGAAWAGTGGPAFGQVMMLDPLALLTRLGVLLLALFTLSIAPGAASTRHPAEFVAMVLFATAGFTLMAVAQQLLLVFLAIELASLSLYVLAGFDATPGGRAESAEAGLKYFLFGGMAAAFLLFGFSLLYGLTGSIELPRISAALHAGEGGPLLAVALVMVLVAFGFKAAAAPFHLWAPDVYQGAPAAATALIASASKLAGVTVFTRLFWSMLGGAAGALEAPFEWTGWVTAMVVVAGASLLLGNLAALAQTNVRRLLAYSAIAHAGVMALGVIVAGRVGPGPVFYYALTYGIATIGAFGVLGAVERAGGRSQSIADLAGLHRRSPLLAGCLAVYFLSLAGVPPFAGFFGKFVIFAAVLKTAGAGSALGGLALGGIALSAVGLYYYLVVLKQAWVVPPPVAGERRRIAVPADVAFTLIAAAGLLLGLGLAPSVILRAFGG
jgi:NADH-quinone oxidoreductase subunit N